MSIYNARIWQQQREMLSRMTTPIGRPLGRIICVKFGGCVWRFIKVEMNAQNCWLTPSFYQNMFIVRYHKQLGTGVSYMTYQEPN